MGSDSDLSTLQPAVTLLEDLDVPIEVRVLSAHRTPLKMFGFGQNADDRGLKVIIAGAGGAAHLPGMLAALVSIPVIGVPVKTKSLDGLDSLYSIVQMPAGIPVATVAIGGGLNAGLLAAQILAISDRKLKNKLCDYRNKLKVQVENKDKKLVDLGVSSYLDQK